MTPESFPYFVDESDQEELAFWCDIELQSWRRAKAAHFVARSQGGSRWAALAVAFDALRAAYREALAFADSQDAVAQQQQTNTAA